MTNRILQRPFSAFAAASTTRTLQSWLEYVESMRGYVSGLFGFERECLFEEAQRQSTNEDVERGELALFQHPSQEAFDRFIEDEEMCEAFAHFLFRIRERQTGYDDVLFGFVSRYMSLLTKLDFVFFYLFIRSNNPLAHIIIHVVPRPLVSKRLRNDLLARFCEDEYEFTMSMQVPFFSLAKFMGEVSQSEFDRLQGELGKVLDLTISDDQWETPEHWKPIDRIADILAGLMANCAWPCFVEESRPDLRLHAGSSEFTPRVKKAREIVEQGLSGVWSAYADMCDSVQGRLSVGLKIHPLGVSSRAIEQFVHKTKLYMLDSTDGCAILPPAGNVDAALCLLKHVEQETGLTFLNSPDYQIQVCSPGILRLNSAAILGISFYLGSDQLTRYTKSNFVTGMNYLTCGRLVIYGAGIMQGGFDWWDKDTFGDLIVRNIDAKLENRTDVIACHTERDIRNVNLVATLLMHADHGGYFKDLGKHLISDMETLLSRWHLSGLLRVPWVFRENQHRNFGKVPPMPATFEDPDGIAFFDMFSDLMNCAFDDARRLREANEKGIFTPVNTSLLVEVQDLLSLYDDELSFRANEAQQKEQKR